MEDDKILIVALIILGIVSFLILRPFLTYVLLSIIITIVSYPLYEKLKSKLKFAPLSAIILIIMIIIVLVVPSIYFTMTFFTQARDVITNVGAADFSNLQKIEDKLEKYFGIEMNFAETLRVWILDISSTIRSFIIGNILGLTRTILNFLAGIVLMFFIMFYLFIDGKRLLSQIKEHFPIENKFKDHLFNRAYQTIQGLFMGLFLTAVIQGILASIGYLLFGMPNVILLGILTTVFAVIPFLGPPFIYIPASIFLLVQGNVLGGFGLLAYGIIIVSQIDNFIRPWFVRFRSKIHPLNVILGVIGGVALIGVSGIIIGPLVLTLFQEVLELYRLTKKKR